VLREVSLGGTQVVSDWFDTTFDDFEFARYKFQSATFTVAESQVPAKDVTPRMLFHVGDTYLRQSAKHCNFAGTECWNVRVHPKIDSIEATQGYSTGGQELNISGWGLNGASEVTVAGVACTVTASTETGITCTTGAATTESSAGYQPGTPGLR